jgi:UDP-glucose 4-epimerase
MKRAVVTGGAGFIGSHLTEELVRRGYQVVILDDLSTGNLENVTHILNSTDLINSKTQQTEFVHGSVTDLPLLTRLSHGSEYIFHLAAIPSVPRSVENPLASHDVNITGTLNVLLAAKHSKVKKVIYASSSAVYGDTPTLPKREDMPPNPQSPYAVTKVAGEHYCQVFHQVYGLSTICLRYFNVYGQRQDPNSQYAAVIPRFIDRLFRDEPPIIFGDGEQTRDFTFVKDAVEATIRAAESDATGVCNVARGERVSLNKLAELIIKLVGNSIEPVYEEPRAGDIKHSLADISRARQLGYNPRYNLEEGLRETMEVMRNA